MLQIAQYQNGVWLISVQDADEGLLHGGGLDPWYVDPGLFQSRFQPDVQICHRQRSPIFHPKAKIVGDLDSGENLDIEHVLLPVLSGTIRRP
jgi:hypothetical protein